MWKALCSVAWDEREGKRRDGLQGDPVFVYLDDDS